MTHIEDLVAFVRGELGAAEAASAREHVAVCDDCRSEAEAIQSTFAALKSTEIEAPSNFAYRTARLAAKPALVPRSAWDRVAYWVTRPIFGYPAWAVSAAVHLLALGALTTIMVGKYETRRATSNEKLAIAKNPHTFTDSGGRPIDAAGTVQPPDSEFALFLGRRGDEAERQALLQKYGSTETAKAVDAGLAWLARSQEKDGSWPTEGGQQAYRTGVTGLAALSFLAHGDSHLAGTHRDTVSQALAFLKAQQSLSGRIGPDQNAVLPQHAIATSAIAEAFAVTGDLALRETLASAVEYLAASRSPRGGWGTSMGASPDAVTTAWSVTALRLADAAGIEAARAPLAVAVSYLDSLTTPDGLTGLREPGTFPNGPETPTAAALFARRWTGLDPDAVLKRSEAVAAPAGDDYIGAQFAALAAIGTPAWDRVNKALKDALLPRQNADGSFRGDKWAGYGGSSYATAMATLTLESCHRYPI